MKQFLKKPSLVILVLTLFSAVAFTSCDDLLDEAKEKAGEIAKAALTNDVTAKCEGDYNAEAIGAGDYGFAFCDDYTVETDLRSAEDDCDLGIKTTFTPDEKCDTTDAVAKCEVTTVDQLVFTKYYFISTGTIDSSKIDSIQSSLEYHCNTVLDTISDKAVFTWIGVEVE